MQQLKKILFVLFFCKGILLFAQEQVLPLYLNHNQSFEPTGKSLRKAGIVSYPLVDYFLTNGKLDSLSWEESETEVNNRKVIFNALDGNGITYANAGLTDVLISKAGLLPITKTPAFLSFTISPGTSYQVTDSFLVYAFNATGNWQLIWQTPLVFTNPTEVVINLNSTDFSSETFAIKFECYTNSVQSNNVSCFNLSKLAVSFKWPLYTYNHMKVFQGNDSTVDWNHFSGPDVRVFPGANYAYVWGNVAKMDVKNAAGQVYENSNSNYGGADTLLLHPIDVSQFDEADSIVLSFMLKSGQNNLLQDSLIVEFKNNLGLWVPVLSRHGMNNPNFINHQFIINAGRFRHANFQARIVFKSTYNSSNAAHWLLSGFKLVKRIQLPFFDDFSSDRIRVSKHRWRDNLVFVNNDFPINHPSLNVATFDGLDQNGNPYSPFPIKGICDKLTTHSLSLNGLSVSDSVLFSFYFQYEPQGTTNQVYPDDSLIVEFRNSSMSEDSFAIISMIAANDTLLNKFTYFEYMLASSNFFHDDFQFRFKNKGSMSGNLSHWHVDYIRFNKGRRRSDPLKDIALSNTPRIYLGPYTSMPWYQYQKNTGAYQSQSDRIRLVNHDNQAYAVDYFRNIIDLVGDTIDKFNNILPTILAQADSNVTLSKPFNFTSNLVADSIVFQTQYRIKISGNQNDNVTGNDTFSVPVVFSNYYAYDDGTAEGGYGIKQKTNVGANLKYKLEEPDSVVGVNVFFNQSEQNVSTQRFQLKVWKSISPLFEPASKDVVLYTQDVLKPTYTNTINGFTSYRFVEPIPVQDSFYIGWEQVNSYVLNVGLDKNYRFGLNPNMYYKMDGRWYPSEIPGALMIRPIMKKFLGSATGKSEVILNELTTVHLFPNPAKEYFETNLPDLGNYIIEIVNMQGIKIKSPVKEENKILVSDILAGFYFVTFENKITGQKFAKKIIINKD
jgi:hypothetical protein